MPPANLLVSESTYGGHTHEAVEETEERLSEVVLRTADRGGKLSFPLSAWGARRPSFIFCIS